MVDVEICNGRAGKIESGTGGSGTSSDSSTTTDAITGSASGTYVDVMSRIRPPWATSLSSLVSAGLTTETSVDVFGCTDGPATR